MLKYSNPIRSEPAHDKPVFTQSSLLFFSLELPALEWCLIGEAGLLVDSEAPAPGPFNPLSGSNVKLDLSSSYFGVNPLSIVVFS